MSFSPTSEQQDCIDAAVTATASLMVKAGAGCAKTTTMTLMAAAMPPKPSLALAFNVKIKKELEKRFPQHFEVKTMNGLGHTAWQRAIGKRCQLDDRKMGRLTTEVLKANGFQASGEQWDTVRQLATAAQTAGLVPRSYPHTPLVQDTLDNWALIAEDRWLEPTEATIELAREVLLKSCQEAFAGIISYDDQIYMSTMFNGVFPRFPVVMVDEAQDLSPLNHIQLKRASTDRLIVVGDPAQAIYGFRGADTESMEKIRRLRSEWIDLPLMVTFRCPKVVVRRQQSHVPGYTAAPSNIEGRVVALRKPPESTEDFTWTWREIEVIANQTDIVQPRTAVLCRNNAPLLSLAFKLIRQGTSVVMLGRDIGKGLIALSKKLIPNDLTPSSECESIVGTWMDTECSRAIANDQESKVAGITDRGECLLAVLDADGVIDAGTMRRKIEALFASDIGKVELATGHRAKGLEWDIVLHLDPWRVPSKHARKQYEEGDARAMKQELNLRYVIETRTKHTLITANLEDFR